ncbi:family 5 glycoside hydrolase [Zopfochytrium polystomum]|nr:family 5 glycoside hydrolase [Zopfochytrium polystomum]
MAAPADDTAAAVAAASPTVRAPIPTAPSSLLISGRAFIDSDSSRTVLLRGVNLSGNAKLPTKPLTPTHVSDGFLDDDTNVSFVGRPFPLDQADAHLKRLKSWGFNFLRMVFTWEALEHKGPGIYDYEFMDYLIAVLYKLREHGFKCFMDPHQDVWSRFTGGSGAPGWTLRAAGLNATNFAATGAAMVQNTFKEPKDYPKMSWSTNYFKLAAGTMFTLFFAGETFAPNCLVAVPADPAAAASHPDGPAPKPKLVNIQEFLQSHYINAVAELAKRIHETAADLEDSVVVGYDTLNEPNAAFIGAPNVAKRPPHQELLLDLSPTIFQGMLMGEGHACEVEKYGVSWLGPYFITKETVDPKGTIAWFPKRLPSHLGLPKAWDSDPDWVQEGGCIWANHGVWDRNTKQLLVPDYFVRTTSGLGRPPHFDDFFVPFAERFIRAVRSHHKAAVSFVEPAANSIAPRVRRPWLEGKEGGGGQRVPVSNDGSWDRICFAPHFYDSLTLITKTYNPYFTPDLFGAARHRYSHVFLSIKFFESGIKACFRDQLAGTQDEGAENIGEAPCVIGEIGIPIDLENGKAFSTGDYSMQTRALDANLCGLEGNPGLNYTLWTYVPDNSNEWGDGWNSEDLSLWSPPKTDGGSVADGEDLDAGARGIKAGYLSRLAGATSHPPLPPLSTPSRLARARGTSKSTSRASTFRNSPTCKSTSAPSRATRSTPTPPGSTLPRSGCASCGCGERGCSGGGGRGEAEERESAWAVLMAVRNFRWETFGARVIQ